MSETYNPRERTFIKAPEVKICPTCGNPMMPEVKPMSNHMNNYMNASTGKIYGSINSNEGHLIIQGVTLYKVDGGTLQKPTSSFIPGTNEVPAKPLEKLPILVPNFGVNTPTATEPINVTLPTGNDSLTTQVGATANIKTSI